MADLFAPVTLGPLLPTTTPLEPDLRQDGGSDVAAASTLAPAPQSDLSALELVGNSFFLHSHFLNFQRQASADFDAMKANMDQFFLIVNGSIIILMQVFVHNLNGKVELFLPTTGWLCFSGGWICPQQKRDKHSDQELCRSLLW